MSDGKGDSISKKLSIEVLPLYYKKNVRTPVFDFETSQTSNHRRPLLPLLFHFCIEVKRRAEVQHLELVGRIILIARQYRRAHYRFLLFFFVLIVLFVPVVQSHREGVR